MNVKHNIIANFVGKIWSVLMALAFLPLYIRFLGVEAYGLIGFYVSLMALFTVFDMGLSITLNRELARLSSRQGAEREARDLTRTFEIVYWITGITIGGAIIILAPFIARQWLNAKGLPVDTIQQSVMLMGLVTALQWPASLYSGGLMGLQRQVLLNGVRVATATFQSGGAVLVLWLISPSILAYFYWQALASSIQTIILAGCLWKSLGGQEFPAKFRNSVLIKNWRFTGGVTGTALLVAILTQADKVVLSKMLSLEMLGYYSLATVVAGVLTYVSNPIFSALFPKLSQYVNSGSEADVSLLYHKGSQLMAFLVCPLWIVVALFSKELLNFWIGDIATVANTHFIVSMLITGTALNSLMFLPYTLQLAYGWTSLSLYANLVSVMVFLPLLLWLIAKYGIAGAPLAWVALNIGYFLFEVPLMHKRLLKDSMRRWYLFDVGMPAALCAVIGFGSRLAMPSGLPPYAMLLWIASTFATAVLCLAIAMPHIREWLKKLIFMA